VCNLESVFIALSCCSTPLWPFILFGVYLFVGMISASALVSLFYSYCVLCIQFFQRAFHIFSVCCSMEFLVGLVFGFCISSFHFVSLRFSTLSCLGFCKIIYRLNCCLEVFACMFECLYMCLA